ncbi:MAG: hypothetical protein QXT45_03695, partial [Candidatus Bilamarchaeaceae archaeon]
MDKKIKTTSLAFPRVKRIFVYCVTLALLAPSSFRSNFINTFKVKSVMAEPIAVKKKSAEEAAWDLYKILGQLISAKPDARASLVAQASEIIKNWGNDKKFADALSSVYKKALEGAARGEDKSVRMLMSLEILLSESGNKALLKTYKNIEKDFYIKEVKSSGSPYYNSYKDYLRSPFYNDGTFLEFASTTRALKDAEMLVSNIEKENINAAAAIIDAKKEDKEFATAVAWKAFGIVEDIIAYGERTKITLLEKLFSFQEKWALLSNTFKAILDSYVNVEGGRYFDLYTSYKLHAQKREKTPEFFDFLRTVCEAHEAIAQGKIAPYEELAAHLLELSKVTPVPLTIKEREKAIQEKNKIEKAIKVVDIRTKQIDGLIKDLKDYMNSYIKDYVTETLCGEIRDAVISEVKEKKKQESLVKTTYEWEKEVKTWSKTPPLPDAYKELAKEMTNFVTTKITNGGTKETLLRLIDGWTDRMAAWGRLTSRLKSYAGKNNMWKQEIEKGKKLIKSEKKVFTDDDVKLLNKILRYPNEIDEFLDTKLVTPIEARNIKKTSMAFVHALTTGYDQSYTEFLNGYNALNKEKDKAPEKYAFSIELLGAFLQSVAPEVYAIVRSPDILSAVEDIVGSENNPKMIERYKKSYGEAFVNLVLSDPFFKELASTVSDEKRKELIAENSALLKKAELLYRLPSYFLDAFEEVYLTIKSGGDIEEVRGKYGNKFVDLVSKNLGVAEGLLTRAEITISMLADEQPELFKALVDSFVPLKQESLLSDLDGLLMDAMSFRKSMAFALTESDKEKALVTLRNAFLVYREKFGENLALIRFVYDVDTIAGKKTKSLDEAQKIFEDMVYRVLSDKGKGIIATVGGSEALNLIGKFYLIKSYDEIITEKGFGAEELSIINEAITQLSLRDQWLLPSFFEKVLKPIASATEGDGAAFSEALSTFVGLFNTRYPLELSGLGYLSSRIRADFIKIFNAFERSLPALLKEMSHFELQDEVREREEMGPKEVYPPYNLYAQRKSPFEGVSYNMLGTYMLKSPLDIIPNPTAPWPAHLPTGEMNISSDAEGLYNKMSSGLSGITVPEIRPPLPRDFRIRPLSRSRLLKAIREAFGAIPLSYSTDLVTAFSEGGLFGRAGGAEGTKEYAGGGRVEATERFAEGGLLERVVTEVGARVVKKEIEGEKKEEMAAAGYTREEVAGARVGPIAAIRQTFEVHATKGEADIYTGTLDALVGLSKKEGHSLLVYVPEAVYETEEGRKAIAGKFYYVKPDGDVYQLGVGHDTELILKSFIFGSTETDDILASFRKYNIGTWTETNEWKNWGGAAGFTVPHFAAFAMEDMIRRVGYTEEAGVKKINLEAVGLSAVPLSCAINAFENGTLAFITRMAVPATAKERAEEKKLKWDKGIYTLELIYSHIEPHTAEAWRDWEFRLMGGYPMQAGLLYKSHELKDEKIKSWFLKAGTASYLLWNSLLTQEKEAENVANYVRNVMAETYHWSKSTAEAEGYFVGGSIMFSGIDEVYNNLSKQFKDVVMWDNPFFAIIGSYYASRFKLFGGVQKLPGYMESTTQIIDRYVSEMIRDPSRIQELSDQLTKQIEAASKTPLWRGVGGLSFYPNNWEIALLGSAEVKGKEGYGYAMINGALHVGYLKGIKPYFESEAYSYASPSAETYRSYMDIYGAVGATEIGVLSPKEILSIETEKPPVTGKKLVDFMNNKKDLVLSTLFTRYYKLSEELMEKLSKDFEFTYAPNLALAENKKSNVYYLLIDSERKKGYVGNEKDRMLWAEKGFAPYEDVFVVRSYPDEERIAVESISTSETVWFSKMKAIGGISLKVPKDVAAEGWTAGLLMDVFKNYKKDILMGTFFAKRKFEEEEWKQFVFTISGEWKRIDWEKMHDRVYGYVFFNYITREVYIAPSEEGEKLLKDQRYTAGTGWSWARFDATLGETKRLELFVEAGVQKFTEEEKSEADFITRAALSYSQKIMYNGLDNWLTFQLSV